MDPLSEIAVIILAAGSSSRMGATKQLLEWKGQPLIARVISTAQAVAAERTVVVLGADHENIQKVISHTQSETVINKDWKRGMGSSISVGVEHVQSKWPETSNVIILLADQPLIDATHLAKLLDLHNGSNCGLAATAYGNKPGVPAIFSSNYFDDLRDLDPEYGARQLLQSNCKPHCMVAGDNKIIDLDTSSDYEDFIKANPRS